MMLRIRRAFYLINLVCFGGLSLFFYDKHIISNLKEQQQNFIVNEIFFSLILFKLYNCLHNFHYIFRSSRCEPEH